MEDIMRLRSLAGNSFVLQSANLNQRPKRFQKIAIILYVINEFFPVSLRDILIVQETVVLLSATR
ncbi:TPA: hypothetical protein DIU27_02625 [Candidatus Collierbacteria bacterium]|nr:hypothetical protein [Candidatus Collierbacteria bacterium]